MFWKRAPLPSVTFATSCWERDWSHILLDPTYLAVRQIGNHQFEFKEKLLVINNVKDLELVSQAAEKKVQEGVLTRVIATEKMAEEALSFFQMKREDFRAGSDAHLYGGVNDDWIYYNSIAPLAAIYSCESDYLLYMTGDVRLDDAISWIPKALRMMEKDERYQVANLLWWHEKKQAKKESIFQKRGFFVSARGFSDTMFLVKRASFRAPIYREIREDAGHYPRGDVFEKRAFSAMKNRGWLRLTYAKASYIHEHL
jgi:hypothetical protein